MKVNLNSIRTKLLIIVSGAFLVSTLAIFFIADRQLTAIIDSSQNELYREKVDDICKVLTRSNQLLEKTGLVDAYREDFQKSILNDLKKSYYNRSDQAIYPFIMDVSGNTVLHPAQPLNPYPSNPKITESLLATDQGDFDAVYENQSRYYSFRSFPEWQWIVGYSVPVDIKYADAREFRNLLILIMGGVILVILLILILLIYRFTKPIARLTEAARAMADGDLDQEIDLTGKDEIGVLAASFKEMCVAVRQSFYNLELENRERKHAEEELAREKEQLAITLRSIGDGVVTTDIAGNIVLMNRVAEELSGWNFADACGRGLDDVLCLDDSGPAMDTGSIVARIMENDAEKGGSHQALLLSGDGVQRTIAYSGASIRNDQNRISGSVVVFRDITEQLRIEQELQKNNKLESIGVLAGGIAHDFNNHLVAILGNIDLVLHLGGLTEKQRKLLRKAEKGSLRAKGLTQQLLTFSAGGRPVKEVVSLEPVIREAAGFSLHGQAVDCLFAIPADLWQAEIDKDQISQVIQNIVMNAMQAIAQSGMIQISCSNIVSDEKTHHTLIKGQNYIRIVIADNGKGIAADQLDRIFDPFFTTKDMGSGMGLSICHSIISRHQGGIKVASIPGAGTTVTLFLPAVKQAQIPVKEDLKAPDKDYRESRVLVMDDEEVARQVAAEMLGMMGHKVVMAEDGAQAVDLFRSSRKAGVPIDVVIMDLTIPGAMGGKEAVKEVLALDPEAKVIVSSGYSNDPVMSDYRSYGFHAAIVKPYTYLQFSSTIEKILRTPC